MTEIVLDSVTKTYGSVAAVDNVDLTIQAGGVHALAGANGSGKTTILRLIAGLTTPTDGTIDRPSGRIGFAFQQPNVYPALSVRENLDVFTSMTDTDQDWCDRLLEHLRLERVVNRPAADLSDGFKKKLDLALAFAAQPPIVLLDEPLADVDDLSARNIISVLEAYPTPDRIVVIATHNVDRFNEVIDRLTILHDGQVIETIGAPTDPASLYDARLADLDADPP